VVRRHGDVLGVLLILTAIAVVVSEWLIAGWR